MTSASPPADAVRRQRRLSLEIRTLTVSLRAALADLDRHEELGVDERVAVRREWCEKVSLLLQDVRARQMRIADHATGSSLAHDAALADIDRADEEVARLSESAA